SIDGVGVAFEGERGANVRIVGEALGEVSQPSAASGIVLLGVEAEVRGRAARGGKHLLCLLVASLAGQTLGEPEGAGDASAFVARETVVGPIAANEAVRGAKIARDGRGRTHHSLVVVGNEIDRRKQEQRRVEVGASEALDEDAAAFVVAVTLDRGANLLPGA